MSVVLVSGQQQAVGVCEAIHVCALQEILEHADELRRRFEDHEPSVVRDAAPLHAIREAVTERAASERRIAEAVASAREADVSWSAIGSMLGTSGEAARQRYAGQHVRSA